MIHSYEYEVWIRLSIHLSIAFVLPIAVCVWLLIQVTE
jgi:hypothetical protein